MESLMAPLMSHRQIQSRSGAFIGQMGLVALPGMNGTVPSPWGGYSWLGCSPRGQQSCWTGRLKRGSLSAGDLELSHTLVVPGPA